MCMCVSVLLNRECKLGNYLFVRLLRVGRTCRSLRPLFNKRSALIRTPDGFALFVFVRDERTRSLTRPTTLGRFALLHKGH